MGCLQQLIYIDHISFHSGYQYFKRQMKEICAFSQNDRKQLVILTQFLITVKITEMFCDNSESDKLRLDGHGLTLLLLSI